MADSDSQSRRSRRDLDKLADGTNDGSPLGLFMSEMRSMGEEDGVEPSRALAEFVSGPSRQPELVAASTTPKETDPMFTQLSTFAATTIGKVALVGATAVVAIGGLFVVSEIQNPEPVETIAADSTEASSTTTTTASQSEVEEELFALESEAGFVVYKVGEGSLVLVDVTVVDGWTVTDESTSDEINLLFKSDDGIQVDVEIELDEGEPKAHINRTPELTGTVPASSTSTTAPSNLGGEESKTTVTGKVSTTIIDEEFDDSDDELDDADELDDLDELDDEYEYGEPTSTTTTEPGNDSNGDSNDSEDESSMPDMPTTVTGPVSTTIIETPAE